MSCLKNFSPEDVSFSFFLLTIESMKPIEYPKVRLAIFFLVISLG